MRRINKIFITIRHDTLGESRDNSDLSDVV